MDYLIAALLSCLALSLPHVCLSRELTASGREQSPTYVISQHIHCIHCECSFIPFFLATYQLVFSFICLLVRYVQVFSAPTHDLIFLVVIVVSDTFVRALFVGIVHRSVRIYIYVYIYGRLVVANFKSGHVIYSVRFLQVGQNESLRKRRRRAARFYFIYEALKTFKRLYLRPFCRCGR